MYNRSSNIRTTLLQVPRDLKALAVGSGRAGRVAKAPDPPQLNTPEPRTPERLNP